MINEIAHLTRAGYPARPCTDPAHPARFKSHAAGGAGVRGGDCFLVKLTTSEKVLTFGSR